MSTSTPAVRWENVTHRYRTARGERTALSDISFEIPAGQVWGVTGPDGAGKSTLLRLATGTEKPTEGRILHAGVDLALRPKSAGRPEPTDISAVFGRPDLVETVTVLDNVALPLRLEGTPRPVALAQAEEALRILQLDDVAGAYPAEVTRSIRQRVALARAVVRQPALLVCDELTGVLSPQTTRELVEQLRRVIDAYGTTVVITTHNWETLLALTDQVIVLDGGRIQEQGPTRDVLTTPQDPTALRFIRTLEPRVPSAEQRADPAAFQRWREQYADTVAAERTT